MTNAMEELVLCQETAEGVSTQLNQELMERDEMLNTGATCERVGTRQWKRNQLSLNDAALWFGKSFGLVPKQLTASTSTSNEALNIPLGKSPEPPTDISAQPAREVDEFSAMQTTFLTGLVYLMSSITSSLRYVTFTLILKDAYLHAIMKSTEVLNVQCKCGSVMEV